MGASDKDHCRVSIPTTALPCGCTYQGKASPVQVFWCATHTLEEQAR
jgi:hypothetical protein